MAILAGKLEQLGLAVAETQLTADLAVVAWLEYAQESDPEFNRAIQLSKAMTKVLEAEWAVSLMKKIIDIHKEKQGDDGQA